MKNFTSLLFLLLACLLSISVQAQVLNGGFELKRTDGTIANWEPSGLIPILLDSPATCTFDSLYFLSNDAHSGNYALAMQSVFCESMVALPQMSASDDIPAYSPSEPFSGKPGSFHFYHKLSLATGNGVRIYISLLDTNGLEVAIADTTLRMAAGTYTYVDMPLQYIGTGEPVLLQMFMALIQECGTTSEITSFLIDDIGSGTTAVADPKIPGRSISVYSVPAGAELQVRPEGFTTTREARLLVSDALGRVVLQTRVLPSEGGNIHLATAALAPGVYTLQLWDGTDCFVTRFIK